MLIHYRHLPVELEALVSALDAEYGEYAIGVEE